MLGALFLVFTEIISYNQDPYVLGFVIVLAIFLIYKHTPNIKRLANGTENKISFKK
jgi:glycerol-3-phosphate acyltransferase PlsY